MTRLFPMTQVMSLGISSTSSFATGKTQPVLVTWAAFTATILLNNIFQETWGNKSFLNDMRTSEPCHREESKKIQLEMNLHLCWDDRTALIFAAMIKNPVPGQLDIILILD
jgi:hypothetical protein